jgi:hypothetical protein
VSRRTTLFPAVLFVWYCNENAGFVVTTLTIIALNRLFLAGLSASQPHVIDNDRLVTADSFATTLGTLAYPAVLGTAAVAFHVIGTGHHSYAAVSATAVVAYRLSCPADPGRFHVVLGPDESKQQHTSVALRPPLQLVRSLLSAYPQHATVCIYIDSWPLRT